MIGDRPLRRIAVVDPGEPALRLIHAVREYREERDRDLQVVALHRHGDTGNLWVRAADEATLIAGDGWADAAAVEQALVAAAVDAVWDGAGFVAARPALTECCARASGSPASGRRCRSWRPRSPSRGPPRRVTRHGTSTYTPSSTATAPCGPPDCAMPRPWWSRRDSRSSWIGASGQRPGGSSRPRPAQARAQWRFSSGRTAPGRLLGCGRASTPGTRPPR